jgi:iron complex transport system permease protein
MRANFAMQEVVPIRRRMILAISAFGALAAASCLLAPLVGTTHISLAAVFDRSRPFADNSDAQIFFIARLPRVLAAALAGSALALAGVVFQALLRNPLASPDTLGISAGASLGAILAITLGAHVSVSGVAAVPLASFTGSIGALIVVYGLAAVRRRGTSTTVLLLAGVTLSAVLLSVAEFVQYLADFAETFQTVRWLMGSLDIASYAPLTAALIPLVPAWAVFATLPRVLDVMSLGADAAAVRGVDVERAERRALVGASVATGAAVSLGGPIAFVGIIVPHLVRLIVGADHRVVLPASGLFGAAFLVACDLVARVALAPIELPVGIVTAMIGGPFFLWLVFGRA